MNTVMTFALGVALTAVAVDARPAPPDGGEPAAMVDQVVVVAHKSERPLRDIAANVTVLSQADFQVELATSMADVLRYVPGVDAEGGGTRFGTEGINIRGIGGNRVALLVDGVPLSDQFSIGSFSNATRDFVNAGFLRRAEVLQGPASALYGSAAIGGVVALQSRDPADLSRDRAQAGNLATVWRDADSSLHATALQSWSASTAGVLLGLSVRDGAEPDSAAAKANLDSRDYRRDSALLKMLADDSHGNTWQFGYYGQRSGVDSRLASMLGSGRFRTTTALEGRDSARMDMLLAAYRFGGHGEGQLSGVARAYFSRTGFDQRTLDERGLATRPVAIDRRFEFDQSIRGMELNLTRTVQSRRLVHRIGAGIEYRQRHTEEFRDGLETGMDDGIQTNVLLGEVFPLRDFPVSDSVDWGLYVEDTVSVGAWTIIAGLRGDRFDLDPANDPMYAEDYPFATPVSVSVSEASPKLGLVFRPTARVDLYAQYAHGFRAPPYDDANIGLEMPLFNYRAIPNPELRSEKSDGFDLGVRWRGTHTSARLALFRTRYHDFIESKVRLGPDPVSGRILFQSRNLDNAIIAGVEVGGTVTIVRDTGALVVDASAYRAHGENRDAGQPLNSVGPAQAVIGADWQPADEAWRWRLQATLTDAWTRRDESGGRLFKPPGYAVFDLYAARPVGSRSMLRLGITNLTDRTCWAWSDVRLLGPEDPVIPYIARPGRSLVAGVDIDW